MKVLASVKQAFGFLWKNKNYDTQADTDSQELIKSILTDQDKLGMEYKSLLLGKYFLYMTDVIFRLQMCNWILLVQILT